MGVYLRAKFEVSSIILTSFRQGVILPPPPIPQNEPLKSPPRLGFKFLRNANYGNKISKYVERNIYKCTKVFNFAWKKKKNKQTKYNTADQVVDMPAVKCGTRLKFKAMKMLKKISLALLTLVKRNF